LYVLDEPSIGLHQRDNERLLETLVHLRDLGNTVIVVEHDEDAIRTADHVVDIGPGAGVHGGQIVAEGTPEEVMANPASITGKYLTGSMSFRCPPTAANRMPSAR
jgi:excinuclease ABC subunit A